MSEIAFSVVLHNQTTRTFGSGRQVARIVANNARGSSALATMDMNAMGEAYLAGDIDVEGDLEQLLSFRSQFRNRRGFASRPRVEASSTIEPCAEMIPVNMATA